jgi:RecA-family ATPase
MDKMKTPPKSDYFQDEQTIEAELLQSNKVNNDKVFIPTWNNKPEEKEPILFINGIGIVTYQNMSCIIAAPGVGKSSICESICAAVIGTKDIDTLGFSVSAEVKGVLYIDNERTKTDVWNSFHRMHKRAKANEKTFIQNTIDIVGLRDVARLEERKEEIENLIKKGAYQLVIIDGAGDLVNDTNSLAEAIECRIWFRELTSKYNVSILTTLHPNKGSITPRGHIGSEIVREAESVIGVMSEGDVRTMTTDFTHGKSRNAAHVTSSFAWSDNASMFAQCDAPKQGRKTQSEPQAILSDAEIKTMLSVILKGGKMSYSDLVNSLQSYLKQHFTECKSGERVVKPLVSYLHMNGYLDKTSLGVKKEYFVKPSKDNQEKLL